MQHRISAGLALALVIAAGLPAAAAPRPILDYRKETPDRAPKVEAQTRAALVEAASHAGMPGDLVVLGHARGSFSTRTGRDDIYLLAEKAPAAADRGQQTKGQLLVAMADGKAAATYVLPAEQRYRRIAGAVDTDRDGRSEVLLEAGFYNMGQSETSVDVVALADGGTAEIRQNIGQVAYDGCENPVGKKEKRASTITLGDDGKLVAHSRVQRCR